MPVGPLARSSTSAASIPVDPLIKPARVGVHPRNPEIAIQPNFSVRNTGPRNIRIYLLKIHLPSLIFTCYFQ